MNKINIRAILYALVMAALLSATSAPVRAVVRAAQDDMRNMPGMKKSKPKPKPTPKPTPQKKRQTTAPAKDGMEGMDMPGMQMPAKPSPSPTPSPEAKPSPSPMSHDMHDMTQPEASPSPSPSAQPSPSPAQMNMKDMNMPAPQASPSPDAKQPKLNVPAEKSDSMEGMDMGGSGEKPPQTGTKDSMPGMNMGNMRTGSGTGRMDADSLMVMSGEQMDIRVGASQSNSIAMGQMGSGTSWQPATTPMYMWYANKKGWLLFLHGDMKLGVNAQGGPRGATKFESQNWIMPMAFRRVGAGTLQLRGMFSLEPFTFPRGGSGQLFQTGETFRGRPIVDAQHPHDFFMELSGTYTIPLGERATFFAYLGFPGEPALGPTAFMHRWSASENPSAPLTHHLQDSTHISFGVFTTGFTYRWFKVEGSAFNGREPDENRYDFEFNPWNSRSVRISFAPNRNWAMQWSYGLLKNPEALEPGDVRRMTASVSYNRRFTGGNWATSLIWGRNRENHHNEFFTLNGYTAETTVQFLDRNYIYTRLELVDKNGLLNRDERLRLGITGDHPLFRIGAFTFGYARDIWNTEKFNVAVGSDFTFYSKPAILDTVYGNNPTSYRFFIRLRPGKMTMQGH